jgi:hypothetical protein
MIHIPRASLVAATPVEVSGAQLVVVAIGGGFEVVAADSFHRLFRPAEAADRPQLDNGTQKEAPETPHPWSKKGKAQLDLRKKKTAKPIESSEPSKTVGIVKQTPAGMGGGENASELRTTEAMLQAVGEAPRTSAETQDRVCVLMGWPTAEKKFRDRVYQAIWAAINAKKIEKRTDPATQLSHLYLVGAK